MAAPANRTAIVTGGGYGIGRAVCRTLAKAGWNMIVVDRDASRAGETVALLRAGSGYAEAVIGDVVEPSTAEAAISKAHHTFGSVHGLVTCAVTRHAGSITDITATQWDETIKVVLYGVFHFCKAVVPELIAAGGGAIVNVSSPDALGRRGMIAYAAAKAAVNTLTTCLAADYLSHRIRVNTVIPGFALTGMTEHYPASRLKDVASLSVAGRTGQPEDAAELVGFLMSNAAETFSGGVFGAYPLPAR